MVWTVEQREAELQATLSGMKDRFLADPVTAVRSQEFIQKFHGFIAKDLKAFLTPKAKKAGIKVIEEAKIFGSFKSKDVDVAVVHPINGPLIIVGVRSQMSSVAKNVLTYYQDIVGEAISLQERFPMSVAGYAYIHPYEQWDKDAKAFTDENPPNHARYARMYAGIGQRDNRLYKNMTGSYDQFAYSVVDFGADPAVIREEVVNKAVKDLDLSIRTFVPRLIDTFHARNLWVEDIFEPTNSGGFQQAEVDENMDDVLVEGGDQA